MLSKQFCVAFRLTSYTPPALRRFSQPVAKGQGGDFCLRGNKKSLPQSSGVLKISP
jgi:hypothetical protein